MIYNGNTIEGHEFWLSEPHGSCIKGNPDTSTDLRPNKVEVNVTKEFVLFDPDMHMSFDPNENPRTLQRRRAQDAAARIVEITTDVTE